jgi:energy-converting hydrogenase Eha subunit A
VRKLLSIGIVLALLVTFIVPVAVAAQDQDECCEWAPPTAVPMPDRTTKTLAGATMWTLLGVTDIMGKAVCATTGQMAANLGGWSDELGVIGVEITGAAMEGIAGLIEYVFESFLDMGELGTSLGDLLRGIAEVLAGAGA